MRTPSEQAGRCPETDRRRAFALAILKCAQGEGRRALRAKATGDWGRFDYLKGMRDGLAVAAKLVAEGGQRA